MVYFVVKSCPEILKYLSYEASDVQKDVFNFVRKLVKQGDGDMESFLVHIVIIIIIFNVI